MAADYQGMSITALCDVLDETASQLRGCYLPRHRDEQRDPAERAAWWRKIVDLRDRLDAVAPDDRAGMIGLIDLWSAELHELRRR